MLSLICTLSVLCFIIVNTDKRNKNKPSINPIIFEEVSTVQINEAIIRNSPPSKNNTVPKFALSLN